jgi:hypothetical protein
MYEVYSEERRLVSRSRCSDLNQIANRRFTLWSPTINRANIYCRSFYFVGMVKYRR